MNKSSEEKIKMGLSVQEAAEFLREIADGMEKGNIEVDNHQMEVNPYHYISVSYKQDIDKNNFSFKFKYKGRAQKQTYAHQPESESKTSEAQELTAKKKEKYDDLKERMEKEFKSIQETVQDGQLPNADLVTSFVQDSKKMCQYPDKGDKYYPRYLEAVDFFEKAFSEEDLSTLEKSLGLLDQLKEECHDRYK